MGSSPSLSFVVPALLAALASALPAQESKPKPVRVMIIGASVSAGFEDGPSFGAETEGDSIALDRVLRPWLKEQAVRCSVVPGLLMLAMFQAPMENGSKQVELALRRKPDLVIAIDFPFWFGYGYTVGPDEAKARLALQDQGLQLLARFDCPVVVGDYPDMSGAAQRMISPRQIPDADTLGKLNARLRQWAKERGNAHVFPLGKWAAALKSKDGYPLPLQGGPVRASTDAVLQADRLHASRLGVAAFGYEIQEFLHGALPQRHPLRTVKWKFEQFVQAAGAEEMLEELAAGAGRGKD